MAEMLSIDFGNTYSKIGIRKSNEDKTAIFNDKSLKWDEYNTCIPTLAAKYDDGTKVEWLYGVDVLRYQQDTVGLSVFRNWKPKFFETYFDNKPTSKKGRKPKNIEDGVDYRNIAIGYFKWLKNFCKMSIESYVGKKIVDIPVRISLPGFGGMNNAEKCLVECLSEAGWLIDKRAPVLPEPFANAIGTFTNGRNAMMPNHTFPNYGAMFKDAGLLTKIRKASLSNGPETAWVFIIDIGGYTVDFAMVGMDLTDPDAKLEGEYDGKKRLVYDSKPIGITNLDKSVKDALSEEKKSVIDKIINDSDQQRLESFHKNIYGINCTHAIRKMIIGENQAEKNLIKSVVTDFAQQVSDYAEEFLEIHQYQQIDDLILTGGGSLILGIRDKLIDQLSFYGVKLIHVYDHYSKNNKFLQHQLKSSLVRGATAIGGASIYFDHSDIMINTQKYATTDY